MRNKEFELRFSNVENVITEGRINLTDFNEDMKEEFKKYLKSVPDMYESEKGIALEAKKFIEGCMKNPKKYVEKALIRSLYGFKGFSDISDSEKRGIVEYIFVEAGTLVSICLMCGVKEFGDEVKGSCVF